MVYFDAARELILLAVLVVAAFTELAYGKVYNWGTVPAMLVGLALGYVVGGVGRISGADWSAPSLTNSGLGMLVAGAIFGVMFLFGAFGAADVKLVVAVGALKGWRFTLWGIGYSALVGGVLALAVLLWKGQLRRGLRDSLVAAVRPGKREKTVAADSPARLTVPYAFAISVGMLWAWLQLEAHLF